MSLIVYGDFTQLLSLVASLRTDALIAEGRAVEWRAVVGAPTTTVVSRPRSDAARREITEVAACWHDSALPGEPVGVHAPGFVPAAGPPAAAYAEAVGAGIGDHVRHLLFTNYWRDQEDIGNPDHLRRLLTVPILHGNSNADVLREYGYVVQIAGGPVTSAAWRLRHAWETAWDGLGRPELPAVTDGTDSYAGHDAIRYLGTLGEAPHTFADGNPYPLPPMPLAARRLDRIRPGLRPSWRDA